MKECIPNEGIQLHLVGREGGHSAEEGEEGRQRSKLAKSNETLSRSVPLQSLAGMANWEGPDPGILRLSVLQQKEHAVRFEAS